AAVDDPHAALSHRRRRIPPARVQVRAVRGREDLRRPAQAVAGGGGGSVEMKHRSCLIAAGAPALAAPLGAAAQMAPRTAWGEPDIARVYPQFTVAPLERAPDLVGRDFLMTEEMAAHEQQRLEQLARVDETEPGTAED